MANVQNEHLINFVTEIDDVLEKYLLEYAPHNIAGMLLARIVHLMAGDPATAKDLLKYVWEQFDQIERNNLGPYL